LTLVHPKQQLQWLQIYRKCCCCFFCWVNRFYWAATTTALTLCCCYCCCCCCCSCLLTLKVVDTQFCTVCYVKELKSITINKNILIMFLVTDCLTCKIFNQCPRMWAATMHIYSRNRHEHFYIQLITEATPVIQAHILCLAWNATLELTLIMSDTVVIYTALQKFLHSYNFCRYVFFFLIYLLVPVI